MRAPIALHERQQLQQSGHFVALQTEAATVPEDNRAGEKKSGCRGENLVSEKQAHDRQNEEKNPADDHQKACKTYDGGHYRHDQRCHYYIVH